MLVSVPLFWQALKYKYFLISYENFQVKLEHNHLSLYIIDDRSGFEEKRAHKFDVFFLQNLIRL